MGKRIGRRIFEMMGECLIFGSNLNAQYYLHRSVVFGKTFQFSCWSPSFSGLVTTLQNL